MEHTEKEFKLLEALKELYETLSYGQDIPERLHDEIQELIGWGQ